MASAEGPAPTPSLLVATWNVAAINNNPFEYWITHEDPLYAQLMVDVEAFLEDPGPRDIQVNEVITPSMYKELLECMQKEGWVGLEDVSTLWEQDFATRKIVSGFMKDKGLGAKRLASMPDRITNTIFDAETNQPTFRPTVINNYLGDMSSVSAWWSAWKAFMFHEKIQVATKAGVVSKRPCEMLVPIKQAKYPAVTELEERVSIPLQCLCQAIFDGILAHMMNVLSHGGEWQRIKESICEVTFKRKHELTLDILKKEYSSMDIICLQETAGVFVGALQKGMADTHLVLVPEKVDAMRDQNSLILLKKTAFPDGTKAEELTAEVLGNMEGSVPVEDGDLLAITATDCNSNKYFIASFHGDTNGLSTKSVLAGIDKTYKAHFPNKEAALVFGLDANTYIKTDSKSLSIAEFLEDCRKRGMQSCWQMASSFDDCCTTYNARTYLQPQLNKACKSSDKLAQGDCNPKDHILVLESQYKQSEITKDNTGKKQYTEGICFPTLTFPSDYGVLSSRLTAVVAE